MPATAPNAIKRIAETIRKQNDQYHFLNKLIQEQGFPIWDKSPILYSTTPASERQSGRGVDSVIIIPLVKQDSSQVQSFLGCLVSGDSVKIRLFDGSAYPAYGFGKNIDSLGSDFVAASIMYLDYYVFGDTVFHIYDTRLFDYSGLSNSPRYFKINPTIRPHRSMEGIFLEGITNCIPITVSNNSPAARQLLMAPPDYFCWTVSNFIEFVSGMSGIPPVIPTNGGSGSGWWSENPCRSMSGENPCGNNTAGLGWTPVNNEITLSQLLQQWDDSIIVQPFVSQCLSNVLDTVKMIDTGTIAKIIYQFSGSIPGYSYIIDENPYFSPPIPDTSANAYTGYNSISGIATTTLNKSKLQFATNLSVARTIMHEAVHAYLYAYYYTSPDVPQSIRDTILGKSYAVKLETFIRLKNPGDAIAQHNAMTNFRNDIKDALLRYCQIAGIAASDISQICDDLSWGGLETTDEFFGLDPNDAARIVARNNAELTGNIQTYNGNQITPIGKKACQ